MFSWLSDLWSSFRSLLAKMWETTKTVVKATVSFCKDVFAKPLYGIAKATVQFIVPAAVGVGIVWSFPLIGCAIASIPISRWISKYFPMSPVLRVATQFGIVVALDALFFSVPFIVYVLAVSAVIQDFNLWIELIRLRYNALKPSLSVAESQAVPVMA